MKLLLDTHALVWWLTSNPKLSAPARELIDVKENTCFVSPASTWEVATKLRIGKLDVDSETAANLPAIVLAKGFTALPISLAHGHLAGQLAGPHRDPFDRMLAAQSLIESLPLISIDSKLDEFGVERIW